MGLMREIRVSHVMTPEFNRLVPTTGIAEIKRILSVDPDADIVVVDEDGRQLGMVGFADIKDVAFEADLDPLLYAADLLHRGPVTLRAGDALTTALKAYSEALQAAWREIHGGGG